MEGIVLAISSAGWTALGAIGGALVGATAGGLVDAIISWRREDALAKAGSRLLAAQLKTADAILATVEAEGIWVRYYALSMSAWPEYRGLLAAKLSNHDFEAVADCVPALAKFSEDMLNSPTWEQKDAAAIRLPDASLTRLGELRSGAAEAYNALARLSGLTPVAGHIHG